MDEKNYLQRILNPGKDETDIAEREIGQEEENKPKFKIIQRGALKYIATRDGKIVSQGYHEFKPFVAQDGDRKLMALIGQLGAQEFILHIPSIEGETFSAMTEGDHEISYRMDLGGELVTQSGAFSYLIDTQTGKRTSKGYHKFFVEDGKIYGKLGAAIEFVKVIDDNKIGYDIDLQLED